MIPSNLGAGEVTHGTEPGWEHELTVGWLILLFFTLHHSTLRSKLLNPLCRWRNRCKRFQELRTATIPRPGSGTCCLPTRWHYYPGSSQELFHRWPCFWPPWPAITARTAFLTGTGEMGAAFLTTVTKTPWLSSQEQLPQTKQRPLTANETKADSIPPPPLSP